VGLVRACGRADVKGRRSRSIDIKGKESGRKESKTWDKVILSGQKPLKGKRRKPGDSDYAGRGPRRS